MVNRSTLAAAAAAAALVLAPLAAAGGLLPVNPIVNGDFERFVPPEAGTALDGTAVDRCFGIGHQVWYGTDSWQQDLEDGDAPGAAGRLAGDPAEKTRDDAVGWSFDVHGPTAEWGDFDHDGDREAKFPARAGSSHNMWQSYASTNQAWTAGFDALSFRIESGAIPSTARVAISLSSSPVAEAHAELVTSIDCSLNLPASAFAVSGGLARADPTDGQFVKYVSGSHQGKCDDSVARWSAATTDDERRAVLAELRIVQLSFWGFHTGAADLVVDDVALEGATTAAEGAAGAAA